MTRLAYFATCAECGEEARTKSGVCADCTIKYDYADAPFEAALMGDECACPSCRSETLRIPQHAGLQHMQFVEFNEVQP